MNDDQKLEYQKLRDEYSLLANMIATTVTFSVGACVVVFGLIINSLNPRIFFFFLPLLIIYPSCYIIISRLQSIVRLAAYIFVFLEQEGGLRYETRYLKFKTKSKSKLVFSQTVLLIYLGLIIIDIAISVSKNFISCRDIWFYITSLGIFGHIFYLMRIDWRARFINYWQMIKTEESNVS
jgi:hypothetical protein